MKSWRQWNIGFLLLLLLHYVVLPGFTLASANSQVSWTGNGRLHQCQYARVLPLGSTTPSSPTYTNSCCRYKYRRLHSPINYGWVLTAHPDRHHKRPVKYHNRGWTLPPGHRLSETLYRFSNTTVFLYWACIECSALGLTITFCWSGNWSVLSLSL